MSSPRIPGHHAGLTSEAILREARTLGEQKGIDALSMRALARRLGVTPNALYTYFPNKEALLDALLDSLLGDIDVAGVEDMDWLSGLTQIMDESRRLLLSHPKLISMFLSRPGLGINAARLGEATFSLLRRAGIEGQPAVDSFRVLLIFSLGYAAIQAQSLGAKRSERIKTDFMDLPQEGFSEMRKLAPLLATYPNEHGYLLGLNWLLDGIIGSYSS